MVSMRATRRRGEQRAHRRIDVAVRLPDHAKALRPHGSRTQNIENNPMQSSLAVAGMRDPAKTF
jgi:hypothetical protein